MMRGALNRRHLKVPMKSDATSCVTTPVSSVTPATSGSLFSKFQHRFYYYYYYYYCYYYHYHYYY